DDDRDVPEDAATNVVDFMALLQKGTGNNKRTPAKKGGGQAGAAQEDAADAKPARNAAKKPGKNAAQKAAKAPARAARTAARKARGGAAMGEPTRLTSPDRIVFEGAGYTKQDVVEYYRAVADWMLPELARRPLSLVRCPDGAAGQCFFQKHYAESLGDDVRSIDLMQKSGVEPYLYVDDIEGVTDLVQMNALEFHPWGSRIEAPELP